ncbi:MAG: TIGR04255 family protein [Methylophilus sp.]|nr:TIGR04255 family protein [Methylophilus sp.]
MSDICYKKNYLAEVIARIDFAQLVTTLNQPILPEKIQEVLKSRYKIFEPSKAVTQGVTITEAGITTDSQEFQQWVYHGENREKTITINHHSITISLREYKDYENFKLDVIEPIQAISNAEGGVFINRTGLRYVNIFPNTNNNYAEISERFIEMIAAPYQSIIDLDNLSRHIQISEYIYDEIKLRIQSGIFNPDYPAKVKNKEFVLDFDAFMDTPHSFENMNNLFDELHKTIEGKFELLITDKLRSELNAD